MNAAKMPPAEIDISEDLVRELLLDQHPDLAHMPLELLTNGWDNTMFRLGDSLLVRLPRRALSAGLLEFEQRWLSHLAPRLPLPIPAPLRCGVAALSFPWLWSVVPYIEGTTALDAHAIDAAAAAGALAEFLNALHTPAAPDAPRNPYRGVALIERDVAVRERVALLDGSIDGAAVLNTWDRCLATAKYAGQPCWVHGDLHPANIVVRDGEIAAVIDFGDITAGDPATDLSVAWMLFNETHRATMRSACATNDSDLWMRAKGNALAHALAVIANSADNPRMEAMSRRTLAAVLSDSVE